MTVTETLPLPREKIRREQDFTFRAHDLYAWPGQELFIHFEYNDRTDHWIFEIEHARTGRLFPKSRAMLEKNYSVWPFALFRFVDTSGRSNGVTSRNLQDTVKLGAIPGPLGGSFHPEAGISQEEEDRILRRKFFDPVR